MIQSINFPISPVCTAPYGGWEVLKHRLDILGIDGVEAIYDPDSIDESFPASMMTGYHMIFYPDWLDFYRQDEKKLLEKFGDWDMIGRIYRGIKPENLMEQFRVDLDRARRLGADYVVFHVSDVSLEESYTYRWLHSDYEVLDCAIEFINELLRGVEPDFDFLVENQWWPGFKFTEPGKTEYLLSGIDYPRTGIMLDTGHLMNTNPAIHSQAEGIKYISDMIDLHGAMKNRIKGMHFHQSISGSYVRKAVGKVPDDFPKDYFEAFSYSYPHIESIDRHRPWTDPRCVELIDKVEPQYLTHELSHGPRRTQLGAAKRQLTTIRKGRGF